LSDTGRMDAAIVASGLVKRFGDVPALDGIDFFVPPGTVFGLLGPNGAGKTTTVRILTTILRPDAGQASVLGHDVVTEAEAVRSSIGLAGQYAAVDENLTGAENLRMVGKLTHLPRALIRKRSAQLLERFELTAAANRPVKTYSGGMRRRLDLAGALVADPEVLFLDEPTTGLDPRSRQDMWQVIADLVAGGTTLLLTTQYLEEADRLASRIIVVDAGRVIAEGTADELKDRLGGERLEVVVADGSRLAEARSLLGVVGSGEVTVDVRARRLSVPVSGGTAALVDALRRLDDVGVEVQDVALHRPTLDDVFLTLTGRAATVTEAPDEDDEERLADEDPSTRQGAPA
jgi:ABC-2 type transport system ATP-binding protein